VNVVSQALGWTGFVLAWAFVIWLAVSLLVGGVTMALDGRRFRRRKPKPENVQAHADELISRHGREAFRINGEAMYEARLAKDFDRYPLLREVSGELVGRLAAPAEPSPRQEDDRGTG
jgi:hypothetical protein